MSFFSITINDVGNKKKVIPTDAEKYQYVRWERVMNESLGAAIRSIITCCFLL